MFVSYLRNWDLLFRVNDRRKKEKEKWCPSEWRYQRRKRRAPISDRIEAFMKGGNHYIGEWGTMNRTWCVLCVIVNASATCYLSNNTALPLFLKFLHREEELMISLYKKLIGQLDLFMYIFRKLKETNHEFFFFFARKCSRENAGGTHTKESVSLSGCRPNYTLSSPLHFREGVWHARTRKSAGTLAETSEIRPYTLSLLFLLVIVGILFVSAARLFPCLLSLCRRSFFLYDFGQEMATWVKTFGWDPAGDIFLHTFNVLGSFFLNL